MAPVGFLEPLPRLVRLTFFDSHFSITTPSGISSLFSSLRGLCGPSQGLLRLKWLVTKVVVVGPLLVLRQREREREKIRHEKNKKQSRCDVGCGGVVCRPMQVNFLS
jgi:hypothetical protein